MASSSDASAPRPYCSADARTNLLALSTFIDSRRPTFIWASSKGESAPGRAPAARQRTASAPYLSRISSGTTTLPLDLLIFLRSGSTTKPERAAWLHGTPPNSRCARTTDENSQVRMMSWPCGRRSIGYVRSNRSSSRSQPHTICGRERRRGPGVEDVGIGDEAAGLSALRLLESGRRLGRRVDREGGLVGEDRVVVVRLAVVVEPVPDRERDAEEALARDEPVAVEPFDPVGEPRLHVAGNPADLVAAGDQRGTEVGVAAAVGDVPLPGRDDLERLVAPLVEVRHALGGLRVAVEVAGGAQRVGRSSRGP